MAESALILSIHPRFCERIDDGTKTMELRKRKPKVDIGTTVIVYETVPTKAIIGHFTIDGILVDSINRFWRKVKPFAAVSHQEFKMYYEDSQEGVALLIKDFHRLDRPVPLEKIRELLGNFYPPQSHIYLDAKATTKILDFGNQKISQAV